MGLYFKISGLKLKLPKGATQDEVAAQRHQTVLCKWCEKSLQLQDWHPVTNFAVALDALTSHYVCCYFISEHLVGWVIHISPNTECTTDMTRFRVPQSYLCLIWKAVKAMPRGMVLPTTTFSSALLKNKKNKMLTTSTPLVTIFSDTPGLKRKRKRFIYQEVCVW